MGLKSKIYIEKMEPRICFIGTILATFAIIFMAVIGWEKYEPVPCVEHSTGTFMLHKKQATFSNAEKICLLYFSLWTFDVNDGIYPGVIMFLQRMQSLAKLAVEIWKLGNLENQTEHIWVRDLEEPFNSTRKRRSPEDEKITYFDRTSKKISNFFDKSLKLLSLTENESDKTESVKRGRSPAEPSCRTLNTNFESSEYLKTNNEACSEKKSFLCFYSSENSCQDLQPQYYKINYDHPDDSLS